MALFSVSPGDEANGFIAQPFVSSLRLSSFTGQAF
jgi:hypothetical protein